MRAIIHEEYGPAERVLRLGEVDKPEPADDAVLVKVVASSVNAGDWRRVTGTPLLLRISEGLRRPKTPLIGVDAAGVVEAVGKDVPDIRPGDEVYGMRSGALAEYTSGRNFVPKPANLSFEQAAAIPAAGCTALQAVRDQGSVRAGEHVLVNGAGGGVGSFTIQLAKAFGAQVTAVTSTDKLEAMRSMGADHVIDYTHEDFTRGRQRYDVIVDCGGTPSVAAFRRVLAPGGRLVLVAAGKGRFGVMGRLVGSWLRARLLKQPVINFIAKQPFNENLLVLKELAEAGKITALIERTYPLSETAAAISRIQSERALGKLVITLG